MELKYLQETLNVPKVPTHPNKSSLTDWLDIYEQYSRIPPAFFPDGIKKNITELIKRSLSENSLDDHKFYVLKMHLRDVDEVVVRRRSVKNKRKNSFLSRMAKKRWRRYRHKYQRSLSKFHHSSKGKDFHKALGRMLKRASSESYNEEEEGVIGIGFVTDADIVQLMLSINSALTHILIEYETKYKQGSGYEFFELFDADFLDFSVEVSNQMLADLTEAINLSSEEEEVDRWNIFHDVMYLAADIFIPSGVEADYEWDESAEV